MPEPGVAESAGGAPPPAVRGTIEGFYGPPWSHEQRLAHLAFSAEIGLNSFVYAPKDDPFHRQRWREPYPTAQLARLGELAASARSHGLRFVYALHPALSMRYADPAEHAALAAKADQLCEAGVRAFALLFDDVPDELADDADQARFGTGPAGSGTAHGFTAARFAEHLRARHGIAEPLLVCPTHYAGLDPTPYRTALADTMPADALIAWTGADVVVGEISRADIDRAAASFRRRLVLWDNFPVNDFDPSRVFLGPLTGRTGEVAGSALAGVVSNAMIQAVPSRLALATVADWLRDPAAYDPAGSARAALNRVAGAGAPALAPLVRVCSSWPPSADQDPELTEASAAALEGSADALDTVAARLGELADGCSAAQHPAELVAPLRPWLDGASATAAAGLAAVRLLRAVAADAPAGRLAPLRADARAALDRAEDRYENVLRPIVPPFVRAALDRTAPARPGRDDRPVALLVTGPTPEPGDQASAEFLDQAGFAVRRAAGSAGGNGIGDAAVVVVAGKAAGDVLAELAVAPVPVLAWRGLVELAMATGRKVIMSGGRLRVEAPGHPLAPGSAGETAVYRGPGWLTVAEPGPGATVIARTADADGGVAAFCYDPGDRLPDGTAAPALRVGLFPAVNGPAPWLLTAAGRDLIRAALDAALDESAG